MGGAADVTALECGTLKEGLLSGRNPRLAHRVAHTCYDVVMAHHTKAAECGTRVGMLPICGGQGSAAETGNRRGAGATELHALQNRQAEPTAKGHAEVGI
jgi:hypothetical protein